MHMPTIEQFLDLVAHTDRRLAKRATELLEANLATIQNAVSEYFSGACGFIVADEDGDVDEVTVQSVLVTKPLLLEVDDHGAKFRVAADVDFTAAVTYEDSENAIYEREDDVTVCPPWSPITETLERRVSVAADITLSCDIKAERERAVSCKSIDDDQPIEIHVHER
jgi:hypothetical protein